MSANLLAYGLAASMSPVVSRLHDGLGIVTADPTHPCAAIRTQQERIRACACLGFREWHLEASKHMFADTLS